MRDSIGARFVAGIAGQSEDALALCFTDQVLFRALIPDGLRERIGARPAAELVHSWYKDSTVLTVEDRVEDVIGDRVHISYRISGVEFGAPYVVEQQLYCTVADGKIERASLVCSGFRPRPAG